MNYYNEIDPFCCAWLQNLMDAGLIPAGHIDSRSIKEVQPNDLKGYTQCHFFAGVGGWCAALALAGWPSDREVWTGSCPCQPFSTAGKRKGTQDERHLWPEFHRLIKACRPSVVMGEQVASAEVVGSQLETAFVVAVQGGDFAKANKLAKQLVRQPDFSSDPRWIDGVSAELAEENYAVRFRVLGAHSVKAPHKRQRLWWVADATMARHTRAGKRAGVDGNVAATMPQRRVVQPEPPVGGQTHRLEHAPSDGREPRRAESERGSVTGGCGADAVVLTDSAGLQSGRTASATNRYGNTVDATGGNRPLGNTEHTRPQERDSAGAMAARGAGAAALASRPWADYLVADCSDGHKRRFERGSFPLAHGIPRDVGPLIAWLSSMGIDSTAAKRLIALARRNRTGRLRGYGNAIVVELAAEFIKEYMRER